MGALADDGRLLHARGQHGVDGVGVDAGVAQHDLGAGDEEVHDLGAYGGGVEGHALRGEAGKRLVDGGGKRDGKARLEHVHDADGATAQRERVGGAGGTLADREQAADGVELVSQGDQLAHRGVGQRIAGEARLIVLADGLGDLRRFTGGGGVVAAHDALDAGELDDGVGDQVGLAQARGTLRIGGIGGVELGVSGKGAGQLLQALGLLAHRAQGLLEHHLVELLDIGLQRMLEVLLVEELRVVETGAHHALVAVDDGGGAFGVAVGDDDELVRQLAHSIVEREVALMHEHGVNDDLLGHLQKFLVEGGDERLRVLGEVDHLEQRLRGKVGGEAGFGLDGCHALADDALALGLRGDHVGGADDVEQVRGGIHRVLAGSQHAMAHGEVRGLGAGEADGQDDVVEHGHNPAHRAHEVLAICGPAAGAGPLDGGDEACQHIGQQVGHGRCRDVLGGEHVLGAVDLAALEALGREALAAGEANGRLGGVAVGVEGDLGRRALVLLNERLGGVGHAVGHDDQAAGAGVDLDGIVGDACIGKRRGHHLFQLLVSGIKVERGDLLHADLERESVLIGHGYSPFSF